MHRRINNLFLLLVIVQALHSLEEYLGHLWEVFPPARIICAMVSPDAEKGFLVINTGLFLAGVLYYFLVLRNQLEWGYSLIWLWIFIELINGIGHPVWSLIEGDYTPGVATAPLLLVLAILLSGALRKWLEAKAAGHG